MKKFLSYVWINVGLIMVAAGIVFFRNPNKFASGGVSGLSLLLTHFFTDVPVGAIMLTLNIAILIVAWFALGKKSAVGSMYGTLMLSAMIWALEIFFPVSQPLSDQKFLELIYSVLIPGVGTALVFHYGATTGGTDIVAQILTKHFKWKISTSLMAADFVIALGAGLLFGAEACMYSVLGVGLKSFLMDAVMENLRIYKIVVIISDKSEEIQHYICNEIGRSATVHSARGAYTVRDREVITSVLSRRQALQVQQFIKETDPAAFITISNSTEIIGKGFGGYE